MIKIPLFVYCFIFVSNVCIQSVPIGADENEDIATAFVRLHQEVEQIRRRLNPIPDLITFASNDIAEQLKRSIFTRQLNENTDSVYVNLKVGPEDDAETKYVNLYIDTKRDLNARYNDVDDFSDDIDTKVVYLDVNVASTYRPYQSYPQFRRRRRRQNQMN